MIKGRNRNRNVCVRYDVRITAMLRLFAFTILGVILAPPVDCATKTSDVMDMRFKKIQSAMGGSVLEPLVQKCNDLSDVKVASGSKNIRREMLQHLSGSIGPVVYSRDMKTRTTYSYGSIGEFEGTTALGTRVSGDIMGTSVSTRTKVLNYKAKTPNGFREAFDSMTGLARSNYPRACAEVGACIFVDATDGMIGMDERKMLDYFKRAADGGDEDGMFMYAFCLYHGIGRSKPDLQQAAAVLERLKDSVVNGSSHNSTCRKCINHGWLFNRLK